MPRNKTFNEVNWSDPNGNHINAYSKSKTLAEKAAWEFQKKLPEDQRFEIVVLNPSMMVGPAFFKAESSSFQIVEKVMNNAMPGMPLVKLAMVDVREVAMAHLLSIKNREAANRRFIIYNNSMMCCELATVMKSEFDPQGYEIINSPLAYWKLYVASFVNTTAATMISRWRLTSDIDNTRSLEVLGVKYGDIRKSILDMTYNMFETGALEDKRKNTTRARL